jgi:hypothetical protein
MKMLHFVAQALAKQLPAQKIQTVSLEEKWGCGFDTLLQKRQTSWG